MTMPIPVICDRCRAQGVAGGAQFADFGGLLDFEPVPRRIRRADGWTAERQRAFIAALAVTGSPRQAARAVGKAQWGVDRLREAAGAEGFNAAWDKAMALAAEKGRHRLEAGFDAVIREDAQFFPGTGRGTSHGQERRLVEGPARSAGEPDEDAEPTEAEERAGLEVIAAIIDKYLLKLVAERRCRLEGRIAEADFYLRQVTILEVTLDVTSGNGMRVLREARLGGHDLLHIAETELSRQLDHFRRKHWQDCGDPPRPEYPPRHLLVEHDGYATQPLPVIWGGPAERGAAEQRRQEDQFKRDAEAHILWEAEARRDYEERRGTDSSGDSYS